MELEFSKHALEQMGRREIPINLATLVVEQPDSITDQDQTTRVYARLLNQEGKFYLYRVFVNPMKKPAMVITVYKTSKIEKYGYKI